MKTPVYLVALLLTTTFIFHSAYCTQKIRLYALSTPSHDILKDSFFLPSLKDDFEVIIMQAEQTCQSTYFMSAGWTQTTIKKVDLILQAITENWGSFFIFSDVDIQFFEPVLPIIIPLLENNDLLFQKNTPDGVLCTGFFACKAHEKTLALWTDVKKIMTNNPKQSDQITLNQCIKRHSAKNPYNLQWNYLPSSFFGGGTFTGQQWKPGNILPIPAHAVMHHANWTKGIPHKIAQLTYVKQHIEKRLEC